MATAAAVATILIRRHSEEFNRYFNAAKGYYSRKRARSRALQELISSHREEYVRMRREGGR